MKVKQFHQILLKIIVHLDVLIATTCEVSEVFDCANEHRGFGEVPHIGNAEVKHSVLISSEEPVSVEMPLVHLKRCNTRFERSLHVRHKCTVE